MADGGLQFHGLSILQHSREIGKLLKQHEVRSVLDYGCGRADAYRTPHLIHKEWGVKRIDVSLYDPAFKEHDQPAVLLRRFDAVLCSDVLEHVPMEDIDEFVRGLFFHAKKVVWASVCCRPARKSFPGTDINLHVTIKPLQWWLDTFNEHCGGLPFELVETP